MRPPRAVLLDFDDTLVDNSVVPVTVERTCALIAHRVEVVGAETLLRANLAAWSTYWPEVERRCWAGEMDVLDVSFEVWRRALDACDIDDPAIVKSAFDTHQRIAREMSRVFDDVPEFLEELKETKIATALVTNSSVTSQLTRLEAVGLDSAFDAVVISGAVGVAKPGVGIFQAALERLGVTIADTWHVGDSLSTDVAGANAIGIRAIWLNRTGRQLAPSDPRPDVEVNSLLHLRDLLVAASSSPR